jgi:hypothetical protein
MTLRQIKVEFPFGPDDYRVFVTVDGTDIKALDKVEVLVDDTPSSLRGEEVHQEWKAVANPSKELRTAIGEAVVTALTVKA